MLNSEKKSKSPYVRLSASDKANPEKYYHVVFLLRPDVSSGDAEDFFKRKILPIYTSFNGTIKNVEYWGLRNLAYRIKKYKKAHFYSMKTIAEPALNTELDRVFKISEACIRHIVIRTVDVNDGPSHMIMDMEADIKNGDTIFDDKYVIKMQ